MASAQVAETSVANNSPPQGPVSRKSRKLFGSEKPFLKLRPPYSVKLVFSYVVKGIKIKITAKFRASIRLRFGDTKGVMSPEMRPKSFGTFEKQAPGLHDPFLIKVAYLVVHEQVLVGEARLRKKSKAIMVEFSVF